MPDRVRLLWTGGWDSSFRLMQLVVVERRAVQPTYVVNPERATTLQEVRTMRTMRAGLLARGVDEALLAPTEVHVWSDYPPGPLLRARFDAIAAGARIGRQYLHLAAVAEARGWRGAELCLEAYDDGPTPLYRTLFTDEVGTLRGTDAAQLFRYWAFPLLGTTKAQMAAQAREHGFDDLLVQRWFCQDPVLGLPCGRCRPCRLANREGVRFAPTVAVRAHRARTRLRQLARARQAAKRPGSIPAST